MVRSARRSDIRRDRSTGWLSCSVERSPGSRGLEALILAFAVLSGCTIETQGLFDKDGDGFNLSVDCDDLDARIGPRYPEADGDGHGSGDPFAGCFDPTGPGFVATGDDCDDALEAVFPGATERCDGQDDNCDGQIDEGLTVQIYFRDRDDDGFGVKGEKLEACALPAGYAAQAGDCNDDSDVSHPGAPKVCDDADNDCDEAIDEGLTLQPYHLDLDGDVAAIPGRRRRTVLRRKAT